MTKPEDATPLAVGSPVDRGVRPRAWEGVGCISGEPVYAANHEPRSVACGPWVPLYCQAHIDIAVAAERERCAPLLDRLEAIAGGVRLYGAPDKDLLAQRIESLCLELRA